MQFLQTKKDFWVRKRKSQTARSVYRYGTALQQRFYFSYTDRLSHNFSGLETEENKLSFFHRNKQKHPIFFSGES